MKENESQNSDARSLSSDVSSNEAAPSDDSIRRVLELDEVFEALGHPRRRYLLYTLASGSDEKTLPELATDIVAWEQDKPRAEVTDEECTRVQIALYHSHVPMLADLDILDYEEAGEIIVRATNTEQVQAVLEGAGGELDARQEAHVKEDET